MRLFIVILLLGVLHTEAVLGDEPGYTLDSNVAFYEGDSLAYVIRPPHGFRLVMQEAIDDGHSLAFIPRQENYDSATVAVTVKIARLGINEFEDVLEADTAGIRIYYGGLLEIREVDSVMNFNGETVRTFYVDDKTRFIPTVMVSYYDGGTEILIFELWITEGGLPRFLAESLYTECLQHFKVLVKGTVEEN